MQISYTIYNIVSIMAKEILTCRVNPEIRKALKREAAKDKRTLSWFVEEIINEFVRRKKLS